MERKYSLEGLEELTNGDRDELAEFVRQFIADISFSVTHLIEAAPTRDIPSLKFYLHRAKGVVLTLCISILEEPIRFLEKNFENSVYDDLCMQQLQFVITTLQDVVSDLEAEFGRG